MKKNLLFFFLAIPFLGFSQKTTDTIHSQKLNEDREITISLPFSYAQNKTKKYPLLIILDGDYLLDPFEGALKYGAYWDDMPEVIIVGITQNQKNERESDCAVDPETGLPEEKGAAFFEFIGQELLPYLQKNYRTAPFKIIAGHDVTAGFLNFYLYKDNPLFNGYISLSPDLTTGMEENIPARLALAKQPLFYYHSTADGDLKSTQKQIIRMDSIAKEIKNPNVNYRFDNFIGDSHYSLVIQSIPKVLYQFFSVYQPISIPEYNDKIAVLPSGYVDYLIKKYEVVEKVLGLKAPIRINDFQAIEAAILQNKAYDELKDLSALANKNYPKSMLADYELALMFEKKEDFKSALKSYQVAYQKQEIGVLTKKMMLEKMDYFKKFVATKKNKVEEEQPTPETTKTN
jgi:predicted alpha/beta superfamily hydrolase